MLDRADDALDMFTQAEVDKAVERSVTGSFDQADIDEAVSGQKREASDRVVQAIAAIERAKNHAAESRAVDALTALNKAVEALKPLLVANPVVAVKA